MTKSYILFDFFGTIVSHSESRTEQGFARSHSLLKELGSDLTYAEFLELWVQTSESYDRAAERAGSEFSMLELCSGFLERVTGRTPAVRDAARFSESYLSEWNKGVQYFDGIGAFLERLSRSHLLGIVTNTHDQDLITYHLDRMDVRRNFATIVTSLELRCRKPRPDIFRAALARLGATSEHTWFVGDSIDADYHGAQAVGMRSILIDTRQRFADQSQLMRVSHLFDVEGIV